MGLFERMLGNLMGGRVGGHTPAAIEAATIAVPNLKGAGKFSLSPDMKVVVSIAMPGQTEEQACFTPLQKSKPEGK
ncbi:MAG: hypothetical protein ACYCZQ_15385 [Burkholderiales bacterium]